MILTFDKSVRIATCVAYGCLGVTVVVLWWTAYRGLDITDESFYLVGYLQGLESEGSVSLFHRIYISLFSDFAPGIVDSRLLRIGLSVVAGVFLGVAVVRYLARTVAFIPSAWQYHLAAASVSIGSLLGYTWLPQTPSYNTFSAFFLQSAVAGFLFVQSSRTILWRILSGALVGFFLAGSFYNKFPNLVTSLFLFGVFALIVNQGVPFGTRLKNAGLDLLSWLAGAVLFSILLFGTEAASEFKNFLSTIFSFQGSPTFDYWQIYSSDMLTLLSRLKYGLAIVLIYMVIGLFVTQQNRHVTLALTIFPLLFMLIFVAVFSSYMGGVDRKYLHFDFYLVATLTLASIAVVHRKELGDRLTRMIWIFLFLSFFLSGALGTGNGLTVQFMIYLAFLFSSLLVVVLMLRNSMGLILMTLVSLVGTSQIVTGMILNPYREVHGIMAQEHEVTDLPGFERLQLDSALYKLLVDVKEVRTWQPRHIFAFSYQTGVILFTEKTPYGFGWYDEYDPSSCANQIARAADIAENDLIFAIPADVVISPVIYSAFEKRGIYFPEHYTIAKQVHFEDCQNLRVRVLNIYLHNTMQQSGNFAATKIP